MARKVFFSFHYQRDLWRANIVRNSGVIEGIAAAGFYDASLWEEAKRQGDAVVKQLIDAGINGTAVTIVLIGAETANRRYVSYEIEQSIAKGNGLLGIRIDSIKDENGQTDPPGPIPAALSMANAPIYNWEYGKMREWVNQALSKANPSA